MLMRYIKTSVAVCLAALSLSSCSSDEMATIEETGQSYMANVTLTASKEILGNTRSSLNENDPKDGTLYFSWEVNDVIYVTDTENTYKGRLVVKNIDDAGNATFQGQVKAEIYNGEKNYKFYFFGNNTTIDDKTGQIESKDYDFSSQDGLLSTLSDDDLLITEATMTFKNGAGSVSVIFERQFAYAHYKLVYNGKTLDTHGVPVTISASNLSPKASVDFTNKTVISGEVASFTVTPSSDPVPDDENGFYVGLVPNGAETTLTFSCTVDGLEFKGMRHLNKLDKNNFYRLNNGFGAIPIEMNPVEPAKNYRIIYCINVKGIDDEDNRLCESVPYDVTGNEYRVLNFTGVDRNTTATQEKNADFVEGYFADFLGWGTNPSAEKSWTTEGYGVEYSAKETGDDTNDNGVIDFTKISDDKFTTVEENGKNYQQIKLYAKGSFMNYQLILDISKYDKSKSDENRNTGWIDYKISTNSVLSKPGFEFLGWTRHDKDGNEVDRDNPFQTGGYVHIDKEDKYGEWNPDYTAEDALKRPIKGRQTLILYPIWKKIENGDVNLNKYTTGSLK